MVQAELLVTMMSVCACLCDFLGDIHRLATDAGLPEMLGKLDVDGDVMEHVLDRAADAVVRLVGGQCVYTCGNGRTPVANKAYRPTANGCGSFGIQIVRTDLPGMTTCCDRHDRCYDTCNAGRSQCDARFRDCLHALCSSLPASQTNTQPIGCVDTADLLYTGALALGCSPYLTAQAAACSCGPPPSGHAHAATGHAQHQKDEVPRTRSNRNTDFNSNTRDYRTGTSKPHRPRNARPTDEL